MDDLNRSNQASSISIASARREAGGRLNRRGQAMIELAVMGSLSLMALALLIQMGLRMNYQQEIEQQTFRQAQKVAKTGDPVQAVVIYQIRNRIMPNPSFGMPIRPRVQTQASSSVTWHPRLTRLQNKDRPSEPLIRVELDDWRPGKGGTREDYRSDDLIDDGGPEKKEPIIAKIRKTTTVTPNSYIRQSGSGGTLSTSADVTSTEDTTLTLNVNRGPTTLRSSVPSRAKYVW